MSRLVCICIIATATAAHFVPHDDTSIRYSRGRVYREANATVFDWVASQVEFRFTGTRVAVVLRSHAAFNVKVDGGMAELLQTNSSSQHSLYTLAAGLTEGKSHLVTLSLRTETLTSNRTTPPLQTPSSLAGFVVDGAPASDPAWVPYKV